MVHLRPLPEGGLVEAAGVSGALPEDDPALSFLGPPIADDIAAQIARGENVVPQRGCQGPARRCLSTERPETLPVQVKISSAYMLKAIRV